MIYLLYVILFSAGFCAGFTLATILIASKIREEMSQAAWVKHKKTP